MGNAMPVEAVYDPLSKPNNFFGIHILFPQELERAAKLVNSSGGDWGYITIPIQSNDRDLDKWQNFMDQARLKRLIPIVRLATEPDPLNTATWRIPNEYDVIDFANFLNSLNWPTKNRYIILFNEINRFDEWGGEYPNPAYYTQLVSQSHDIFKSRNDDFYIILGGLDNASVTDGSKYINPYEYLRLMYDADSNIFNKIDGFSSHSYPNPGFSALPSLARMGVATFLYEYDYINARATSKKYAFITETGWDSKRVGEARVGEFYTYTFGAIWGAHADKLVAVTPFLLESDNGQFDIFTFYKNGNPTQYNELVQKIGKAKGEPIQTPSSKLIAAKPMTPKEIEFSKEPQTENISEVPYLIRLYLRSIFGLL